MSTNISNAWHTGKPTPIFELVSIANDLRQLQSETLWKECADRLLAYWSPYVEDILEMFPNDTDRCAAIVAGAVHPILLRNQHLVTWVFPSNCRDTLDEFLARQMKDYSDPKKAEQMDNLSWFCREVYETFNQSSDASLCFLSDHDGKDVYIKGFALTEPVAQYLNTRFERFDYTDATEMEESDFPSMQEAFKHAKSEDERYELVWKAQHERGALWDAALNGNHIWRKAGLSFRLDDVSDRATKMGEIRKTVRYVLEKVRTEQKS